MCTVPGIKKSLHGMAFRMTRDTGLSMLNRNRVFNYFAEASAPAESVSVAVPIPELPGAALRLQMDLGDMLSRQWYYLGYDAYEVAVRKTMWALIRNPQWQGETHVIDVGANLGYFTLYLARILQSQKGGEVHAFEPSPGVFARLERNASLNPELRVVTTQAAISCSEGTADLYLASQEWGHSAASLVPAGVQQIGAVQVTSTTLDRYAERSISGKVGLIKLDCEGSEADALLGAKELIRRDKPDLIVELIPRYAASYREIFNRELLAGYRTYWITPSGLIEREQAIPTYEHRDWLLSTRRDVPGIS